MLLFFRSTADVRKRVGVYIMLLMTRPSVVWYGVVFSSTASVASNIVRKNAIFEHGDVNIRRSDTSVEIRRRRMAAYDDADG